MSMVWLVLTCARGKFAANDLDYSLLHSIDVNIKQRDSLLRINKVIGLVCECSDERSGPCFIKVAMIANLCWNGSCHDNRGSSASWLADYKESCHSSRDCYHSTFYETRPWTGCHWISIHFYFIYILIFRLGRGIFLINRTDMICAIHQQKVC